MPILSMGNFATHFSLGSLLAVGCTLFPIWSSAAPTGFALQEGSALAPFQNSDGTFVIESGKNALIDWESFSITKGEHVQFNQADANSCVLNCVVGFEASQILGDLSSNGIVHLVNPNGILIGSEAHIETAGFIASTLGWAGEDLAGKRFVGGSDRGVVNEGIIHCFAGDVFLIGRTVENTGQIVTESGRQGLLSGCDVLIRPLEAPQVWIRPGDEIIDKEECAENPYALAIRHTGRMEVKSPESGAIYLVADEGLCEVSGSAQAKAGTVHVLGSAVHLLDGADIDVSGDFGGGTILVGGDYQGKNPEIKNAKRLWAGPEVRVCADALEKGNGGTIVLWSDEATFFYGRGGVKGGPEGGDGGLMEVSGNYLEYRGLTDSRAPMGQYGTLLLDPNDITITASADSNITNPGASMASGGTYSPTAATPATCNINVSNASAPFGLVQNLAQGNVTITTVGSSGSGPNSGSISVTAAVGASSTWTAATTLTLTAASFISITAAITNTSTSSFTAMNFTANGTASGANSGITLGSGGVLTTSGGAVTLNGTASGSGSTAVNGVYLNSGSISTGTGSISVTGAVTGGSGGSCGVQIATTNGMVSTSGTITVSGNAGGSSGASSFGLYLPSTANWTPGTNNTVTLSGTGGTGTNCSGAQIVGTYVGAGPVIFSNCIAGNTTGQGVGLRMAGNFSTTGSITATTNIQGYGAAGYGCENNNNNTIQSGGSIAITAIAFGSTGTCHGIYLPGGTVSINAGSGSITLIGTGGPSSTASHGISLLGGTGQVSTTTGNGNISLTGTAGSSGSQGSGVNYGVNIDPLVSSGVINSGSGTISVTGTSYSTVGGSHGISVGAAWSPGTSALVTLSGTGASAAGCHGVNIAAGFTGSGPVTFSSCLGGNNATTGGNGVNIGAAFVTSGNITATSSIQGQGNGGVGFACSSTFQSTGTSTTIAITATALGTTGACHGISLTTGLALVSTTGGGSITLIGTGGASTTAASHGINITGGAATVSTTTGSGSISLTGTAGSSMATGSAASFGVNIAGSAAGIINSTSGTISVSGTSFSTGTGSNGVSIGASWSPATSATVTFSSCNGGSGTSSHGVNIGGALTLSGVLAFASCTGGTGTTTCHGVNVGATVTTPSAFTLSLGNAVSGTGTACNAFNIAGSFTVSGGNSISMTATSQGSGGASCGINISSGTTSVTGAGTISLTGTGSSSSATAYGVYVSGGTVTAVNGNITLNGAGGTSAARGVQIDTSGSVTTTGTGTGQIGITANSPSANIGLGACTISCGSGSGASITFNQPVVITSATTATVTSAGSNNITFGTIDGPGTMSLSCGGALVVGNIGSATSLASFTTAGAGSWALGSNVTTSGLINSGLLITQMTSSSTFTAGDSITVSKAISWSNSFNLSMTASGAIFTTAGITSTSSSNGNISLIANGTVAGTYTGLSIAGAVSSTNGTLTLTGNGGTSGGIGLTLASGAAVTVNTGGATLTGNAGSNAGTSTNYYGISMLAGSLTLNSGTMSNITTCTLTGVGNPTATSSVPVGVAILVNITLGNYATLIFKNCVGGGVSGTANGSYGVQIGGTITGGTNSAVNFGTIHGGGSGSGVSNYGVFITTAINVTTIQMNTPSDVIYSGNVSGSGNNGLYISGGASVGSSSTQTISLVAKSLGTASGDHGIYFSGGSMSIASGGTLALTGTSGIGTSGDNGVWFSGGTLNVGAGATATINGNASAVNSNGNYGILISAGTINVADGATLILNGNAAGLSTSTGSGNYGISCSGGTLNVGTSTGATVTFNGTGGAGTGGSNYGVNLTGTTLTFTGSSTLINFSTCQGGGTGGSVSSSNNYAVYIAKGITTTGTINFGNITGGGSLAGANNYGLSINNVAVTAATIQMQMGTTIKGGNTSGSGNHGFYITGTSGALGSTSSTTTLSITGASSGMGGSSYGILMDSGSINVANSGTLTLQGTGGGSSGGNGSSNFGISLTGGVVVLGSTSGSTAAANLTGVGGQGSGGAHYGANVSTLFTAPGTNTITFLNCTGGSGSGGSNYGVNFSGSALSSSPGTVTFDFTTIAGGSGVSGSNHAVVLALNSSTPAATALNIACSGLSGGNGGNSYGLLYNSAIPAVTTGTFSIATCFGGSSGSRNYGVLIQSSATLSWPTLTATTAITGGAGSGINNIGFYVSGGTISCTGALSITASSSGTGGTSPGIQVDTGGSISALSATLSGTGGNGAGSDYGIYVTNSSTIQTTTGTLSLTGAPGNSNTTQAIEIVGSSSLLTTSGMLTLNSTSPNTIYLGPCTISSSSGGTLQFNDPVFLGSALSPATSGPIIFNSTIDGTQSLTLNAGSSTITLSGNVGSSTPLSALTIDSSLSLGANITTGTLSLPSSYGVTLIGSSTITTTAASMLFPNTIVGNGQSLTLTTSSPNGVTLSGNVGLIGTPLGALTISAGASGLTLSSTLSAIYTSSFTVGNSTTPVPTTLLSGPFSITTTGATSFNGAITGTGVALTLKAGSSPITVGNNVTLTSLAFDSGNTGRLNLGNSSTASTISLSSSFAVPSGAATMLTGNVTVNTSGANITFNNTIDGAHSLNLQGGPGVVMLGAAVGGSIPLASLTATATGLGTIAQSGTVTTVGPISYIVASTGSSSLANNLTTSSGAVNFTGPVQLTGAVTMDTTASGVSAGANIDFGDATTTINGAEGLTLTTGTGTVLLNGNVGTMGTPLGAFIVSSNTTELSLISTLSNIFASSFTVTGSVPTVLGSGGAFTITTGGAISFGGAVTGAAGLTLAPGTGVIFTSTIGSPNPLTSLTFVSGNTLSLGGNVTLVNSPFIPASGMATTLTGSSVISTGTTAITFPSTITGTGPGNQNLTLTTSGVVSLLGNVGATELGNLIISSGASGLTLGSGLSIAANLVAVNGTVPTTLNGGNISINTNFSSGTISFGGDVSGAANFTLNPGAGGGVVFSSTIGFTTSPTSLNFSSGSTLSLGGNVSLTNSFTTALGMATALTGNVVINTGSGVISFLGTINGTSAINQNLTLTTTGAITLSGSIGSSIPLGNLSVTAGASGLLLVTSLTSINANSFSVGASVPTQLQTGGAFSINAGSGASAVVFGGTIDGTANLTLSPGTVRIGSGGGTTTLSANVGPAEPLSTFTVSGGNLVLGSAVDLIAAASISLDSGSATTLGFVGATVFDTHLSNGNILLAGTLDGSIMNAQSLTVTAGTGSVTTEKSIGSHVPLGNISIGSSGLSISSDVVATKFTAVNSGLFTFSGNADLSSNFLQSGSGLVDISASIVTTGGNIGFNSALTLVGDPIFEADAGTISFTRTVDGTFNLILIGEAITFGGAVGSSSPLGSLIVTSETTINVNGNQRVSSRAGVMEYNGEVIINSATEFLNQGTGGISFQVTSGNAIQGNYNLTLMANLSAIDVVGDINLSGSSASAGGNLTVNSGLSTAFGGQILTQGGASAGIGGAGGAVVITSSSGSVSVSNINTSGGIGVVNNGLAGNITLQPVGSYTGGYPNGLIILGGDLIAGTASTTGGVITLSAARSAFAEVATITSGSGNDVSISGASCTMGLFEAMTVLGKLDFACTTVTLGDLVALDALTFETSVATTNLNTHGDIQILNNLGVLYTAPTLHFLGGSGYTPPTGTIIPTPTPANLNQGNLGLSESVFRPLLSYNNFVLNYDAAATPPPPPPPGPPAPPPSPNILPPLSVRQYLIYQIAIADAQLSDMLPTYQSPLPIYWIDFSTMPEIEPKRQSAGD